jgi:hypothetical protein
VKRTSPFQIIHPVRKERWINGVIYAEFGAGKTYLAATAADVKEMSDVLFIDAESGDMSLQDRPKLDVIRISEYRQLSAVYEFLKLHCKARDENDVAKLRELDQMVHDGDREPPRYRTVVIDSLSEIFRYVMMQITGIKVGQQKLDVEPDQPGYGEWGRSTEMVRLLVRSFRDLPIHTLMVCSEKSHEDRNKKCTIGLNLPKALAAEVPGFFDLVAYLQVNATGVEKGEMKIERRLYLSPGQTFLAKSRFVGIREPYIVDPSMRKLYDLVKQHA